jgi:hypothetical protein
MSREKLKNKAAAARVGCDGCNQNDKQMWINEYLARALSNQTELPTYDEDKLYSTIEAAIIRWNIDGTKTAGELTREIMEIIKQNN